MSAPKAKLQLQAETEFNSDYFHLLAALGQDSSKFRFLGVNHEKDFVLDTPDHILWEHGLTLTLRSADDETNGLITTSIVLKETVIDKQRPYFEVSEREERCLDNAVVEEVLKGAVVTASLANLVKEVLTMYPNVEAKSIGSFQSLRHNFQWGDVILEDLNISYCVHMASKSSLFFSYLRQTPDNRSMLPAINDLMRPPHYQHSSNSGNEDRDSSHSPTAGNNAGSRGKRKKEYPHGVAEAHRQKSRESSARYRKRKVEEQMSNQQMVDSLNARIKELENENIALRTEVKMLRIGLD
ncbi:hypothetical protein HK101_004426 [Irineochytrium annulatum]|nr:hypothetical protein HK101_004426 [Irineochytrium annulatum]